MKPLLCALGRHRWTAEVTEDGQAFRTCARCGSDEGDLPAEARVPIDQRDRGSRFFDRGAGGFGPPS
ncbi:hypothetical protein [Kineococcus sp. SYSU DK002]|uniref:hypothetical protein n=1 Tax=Kineococcus sp. SYSU DK002 TaxID=3383123 RepID=UPI003D7D61B0